MRLAVTLVPVQVAADKGGNVGRVGNACDHVRIGKLRIPLELPQPASTYLAGELRAMIGKKQNGVPAAHSSPMNKNGGRGSQSDQTVHARYEGRAISWSNRSPSARLPTRS